MSLERRIEPVYERKRVCVRGRAAPLATRSMESVRRMRIAFGESIMQKPVEGSALFVWVVCQRYDRGGMNGHTFSKTVTV